MMNGKDPTRPIAPAFVKPVPAADAVPKRKGKQAPTGGLMSHPVLYARLGGKSGNR